MAVVEQLQPISIKEWRSRDTVERKRRLWLVQTEGIQQHFIRQAQIVCQAIVNGDCSAIITFPDLITLWDDGNGCWKRENVARRYRQVRIGFPILKRGNGDFAQDFVQKMSDLQRSSDWAVAACAEILRYQSALSLVQGLSEEFVEDERTVSLNMAFDRQCQLISGSLEEAREILGRLRAKLSRLGTAFVIDADIEEDSNYQLLHTQLTEIWTQQGCAYAHYQTLQLISTIRQRAAKNSLNRGLSISLPYFDDRDLQIRTYDFEVIPPGRIAFEPSYVVRAAQKAKVEVEADTRLSQGTRKRLLEELDLLEKSFAIGRHYMPIGMLFQIEGFTPSESRERREKFLQ